MIQVLTYSGNEIKLKGKDIVLNKLHDAQSLDEFEINVINLQDERIWQNDGSSIDKINCLNDFKSLSVMINTKKKSKIIILLPQNISYSYYKRDGRFTKFEELKNFFDKAQSYMLNYLYKPLRDLSILYENTKTKIGDDFLTASFCFNEDSANVLTHSFKSKKQTTIDVNGNILSTLNISSYDEIINFLREIKLIKDKEEVPDWIKEEKMFDDAKQLKIIEQNNEVIKTANQNIDKAMESIRKNERYKSILYTSGDELVNVVFEILEEMLGWDLSSFEDVKKEDFNYKDRDKVFIGEIKGITSNVKSANVSQLDVHVQEYIDEHGEEANNIASLLIIDHQRNRPLSSREPVHSIQIKLAERNESLIVETISLLKMFEKYLNKELSREKCLEILTSQKGLLTI